MVKKVIKRNGLEVTFEAQKIETAILKAMKHEGNISQIIAKTISEEIEAQEKETLSISQIETLVFTFLCKYGFIATARAYEGFRKMREYQRQTNTSDKKILGLMDGTNQESLSSNSNKSAKLISTQRDLVAEEVSKDICLRDILPAHIAQAHQDGIIYIHDLGHLLNRSHNCMLINLYDMLWNGTVINGKRIRRPNSFRTACTIATQVIAQIASGQHGGQTITLAHLAPFVKISHDKICGYTIAKWNKLGINYTKEMLEASVQEDLAKEVKDGIQTLHYQLNTLQTSNGQAPFLSLFMYSKENPEYEKELIMLIEEVLTQRLHGFENEVGAKIYPAFPKLLYVLADDNIESHMPHYALTQLAIKCAAETMMPDFVSEKIHKQNYNGLVIPAMGCRSHLSPWYNEEGEAVLYSRFNMGVCTINLADAGLSAKKDLNKFWRILEERLELCYEAQMLRYKRLTEQTSDSSPIHWQHGAIARLAPGESIAPLLENGFATISLGYIGVYECVYSLIGESHTTPEGKALALQIMRYMRKKCDTWKLETKLAWGLYGTPSESLTDTLARTTRKRFGEIENITTNDYLTNSYHVNVREEIDAFSKLIFESEFHSISSGGAISYIEVPNLTKNLEAVEELVQFIYENVQYAELNFKIDNCHVCNYSGEFNCTEALEWECPNCGNKDRNKMNILRRTCGYLGEHYWCPGRTAEIKERVLHL